MTDDATQSAPTPIESASPPEAATLTPVETTTSPESTPVIEQAAPTEPASVIPEESQSAPESIRTSPPQQIPAAQSSKSGPSSKWSAADRARAVAKHVGRKESRLVKVIALAKEKRRITNDDIEKLLHVSDATASRYGTILVRRGLLMREGKGRGTGYALP